MKMKYNDFEQQWQALSDDLQSGRCPMTDAELDREVRQVLWSGERRVESGERRAESGEWRVESGERRAVAVPGYCSLPTANCQLPTEH